MTTHKGLLLHLATCKKEPFAPNEEEQAALTKAFALARHHRMALQHSFYWKVNHKAVLFIRRGDVVIVKKVPRNAIGKWQAVQLKRKKK